MNSFGNLESILFDSLYWQFSFADGIFKTAFFAVLHDQVRTGLIFETILKLNNVPIFQTEMNFLLVFVVIMLMFFVNYFKDLNGSRSTRDWCFLG